MRKVRKIKIDHNSEFDLDLAPLLAVMVKLVPVLLLSSAFVQMMVIETELPQVVSQAIQKQEKTPDAANISLEVDGKVGIYIVVTEKGKEKIETIPLKDGGFDLPTLHAKLVAIKKAHPEIFKIEMSPDGAVPYNDLVKIMDEARQSRDNAIKFPVFDSQQGKQVETIYMFPEVTFANTLEG